MTVNPYEDNLPPPPLWGQSTTSSTASVGYGYITLSNGTRILVEGQRSRPADEVVRFLDQKWDAELGEIQRECFEAEKDLFAMTDNLLQKQGQQPIGVLVTKGGAAVPINLSSLDMRIAQKRAFGGE